MNLASSASRQARNPSSTGTDGAAAAGRIVAANAVGGANALALAAAQNLRLSQKMEWKLGARSQHGWLIYVPLISREIESAAGVGTKRYAAAVARWQRSRCLPPTGVFDAGTWAVMRTVLQSRRLKDRSYPSPEMVVTAPAEDFYQPERPAELRQVERRTYEAYKRMRAAAQADPSSGLAASGPSADAGDYLKIISAFRSREYQEQLRRESPASDRTDLAVVSPHFTGKALDLYVGGDPVSTKDDNRLLQTRTPIYRWLVEHAASFGFTPYFYEPWHWEYTGA